ncbi:MAG TPA: hypothetical protein DFR83_17560 [Deltaproteobacteria bacterium]|nr:hypothetical protein [Deltaproteobacteria bacterium]
MASDSSLTADELQEARARFESDLAEDHAKRVEKVARQKRRSGGAASAREQEARNFALNALRAEVQSEFYKQNGYKLYTDSTGRKHWLTPGEYEHRMERRKRRRHRVIQPAVVDRGRNIVFMVGMVLLAVALGFALAR